MRRIIILAFVISLFCLSFGHAGNNSPGSVVIEDNVDLTISGAGIDDIQIDFVLKYYQHPDDPDNLYWKLDLDSLKLSDERQLLRSGSYSFVRDFVEEQTFFGNYEIYDNYLDITVHNREDWTEGFARWIFGKIESDNKIYEIVKTFDESSPSRIVAEYLGIVTNEYGWDLHKFRLHFPDSIDATNILKLYPGGYDLDWWDKEYVIL